jgi:hypothetical protein
MNKKYLLENGENRHKTPNKRLREYRNDYSSTLSPVGEDGGSLSIDVVVEDDELVEDDDEVVVSPAFSQRDQAKYEAIFTL